MADNLAGKRVLVVQTALLDVSLHGEPSFAIAERLDAANVPYMFLTGCDSWSIPDDYRAVARLTKPSVMARVVEAVEHMVTIE